MSRARNGEGSIFKKLDRNGRIAGYRVEVTIGYQPDGRRIRTRRSVKTLEEAKRLKARLLVDLMDGRLTTIDAETVAAYGLRWVRDVKSLQVRPTTAADYESRLRRWIIPHLGKIRLIDLRAGHVESWLISMRRQGLSAPTVNGARQVLNAMCKHAVRSGTLASNPVLATDPVKRQASDKTQVREHWGLDEMWRVLKSSRDHQLETMLHLMIHTGIRPGEALGLRWEDVELENRMLHINGTLKSSRLLMPDGQGVVRQVRNGAKTKESNRSLPIPDALAESLERQQMRQSVQRVTSGDRWVESGYVLTSSLGTPCVLTNVRKIYRTFLESIGVRYIRLHDIRHSVAHVSLNECGLPIEQTSQALGHSRIDTTKRIYARSVPRYNEAFIEGLSRVLPSVSIPTPPEAGESIADLNRR